ncbi:MAG: hypothetical protein ACRC6V_01020 [Bacteroidales bacterium]
MKKVILIAVVAASSLLAGCSASVSKMSGPNGERMMSVSCSKKFQDWGTCMAAVAETCSEIGMGYKVIQRNAEQTSGSYAYIDANTGMAQGNSYSGTNRQLFAMCVPFK